jgi:nitroimidazol reductase NimA-like FMN-containing flavoprotein (pyridoxamine 5'-phosphate oxidase superfamily)
VTIVRVGATKKYSVGWESAFGRGKAKAAPAAAGKKAGGKKSAAKASAKKKSSTKKAKK